MTYQASQLQHNSVQGEAAIWWPCCAGGPHLQLQAAQQLRLASWFAYLLYAATPDSAMVLHHSSGE